MYNRIKHMPCSWILRANRARAVQPFGMVQNTYRTRTDGTIQSVSTHLCLHLILKNHAKSKLDSDILANLWVINLLKQIINHNRSKFVLSKLVLTGVCCKHFMYTCMHRSCRLSSVHVECMSPTLWSDFYLTSKIPTIFF